MARRAEPRRGGSTLVVVLTLVVLGLAALIAWRTLSTPEVAFDVDLTPPLTVPDAPLAPRPQ